MMNELLIIPGAQRSGSSLLRDVLQTSMEVAGYAPSSPEPRFFINNSSAEEFQNYLTHFDLRKRVLIEKSTSYYENPQFIQHVKSHTKHFKLLIILRNPMIRAISNYHFSKSNGLEDRDIEEALFMDDSEYIFQSSVNPRNYLERGNYFSLLQPILHQIEHHQYKIITYESLTSQTKETLDAVAEFLKISKGFNLELINRESNAESQIDGDFMQMLRNYYLAEIRNLELLLGQSFEEWYD